MTKDASKRAAAAAALALVEPGMRLGLGTGSTAWHFVDLLAERVAAGLDVICVPTSEATRAQAEAGGIRLTTLDETPELDLTVDGADEMDDQLRLIKGGGGALLREKIVAAASRRMVAIADGSKLVDCLGRFPLPVEVNPFGYRATLHALERTLAGQGFDGVALTRRLKPDGAVYITDGGHWIVDCALQRITEPEKLSAALLQVPGVVEHGLFIGLCHKAYIATATGLAEIGPNA
jgi:ribose 5-phosphate isomerase A